MVVFIEVHRDLFLQALELVKPTPIVFEILNTNPRWARLGIYIIAGLAHFLAGASCLLLLRCLLPEKYKCYITWSKLEKE